MCLFQMYQITEHERQNSIYKDVAAFNSIYPEVQQAVAKAIAAVVRTRPPDPFVFIAQKLREVNNDIKLERSQREQAAVMIQKRAKGMHDRKRVKGMKKDKQAEIELVGFACIV